jgi:hypothetical protein
MRAMKLFIQLSDVLILARSVATSVLRTCARTKRGSVSYACAFHELHKLSKLRDKRCPELVPSPPRSPSFPETQPSLCRQTTPGGEDEGFADLGKNGNHICQDSNEGSGVLLRVDWMLFRCPYCAICFVACSIHISVPPSSHCHHLIVFLLRIPLPASPARVASAGRRRLEILHQRPVDSL